MLDVTSANDYLVIYNITLVLRSKLSTKLDACIMDRPCPEECLHKNKQVSPPVHQQTSIQYNIL